VTTTTSCDIDVTAVFEGPFFLSAKRAIWGVENEEAEEEEEEEEEEGEGNAEAE
jgi:hypothetical protein